jgi:electron transfer flavoprotein beta subunit
VPSLTQVIKMDVADGKLTCERRAEYGYDTIEMNPPAMISASATRSTSRYPSLKRHGREEEAARQQGVGAARRHREFRPRPGGGGSHHSSS